MPLAVNDEPNAQQGRSYEESLEMGDGGGHRIASDTRGDYFDDGSALTLPVAYGENLH